VSFAAGHDHGILAKEWSVTGCMDEQDLSASQASVKVRTGSLGVDSAESRSRAGLNAAGPTAKDIVEIQRRMLDPSNLAAQSHPEIRFTASSIEQQTPARYLLTGAMTIRGITRPVSVPVEITTGGEGTLRVSGILAVAQFYAKPGGGCIGPSGRALP